jgi:energy-coupling factor transport system ATP-binding protein
VTVELRDVTVRFPRRTRDTLTVGELSLRAGEQLLVLGGTGSGKSTLLQTLTGVVPHSVSAAVCGEVLVCGHSTAGSSVVELSRHIGVLAQDPGSGVCLPFVDQELALPLENRAVPPDEITDRVGRALAAVGAAALGTRRSSELSGGEMQRVALAATLVARPAILLLDEPTSMLDAVGVASVRRALADASDEHDPTIVLVEHRLDELAGLGGVAALPGRALVLDDLGEVTALGPTPEVLAIHARTLQAQGCWLPLESELLALTGAGGGLAQPTNRDLLHALGRDTGEGVAEVAGGAIVLSACQLALSRQPVPRRGRRTVGDVVPVLREVDLELRGGEVVALLGVNGSGKSTLLLALAGLLPLLSGSVAGARPGLVFQNPEHQFVGHNVADEVGHGLVDNREEVVAEALRRHRLERHADQSPFRLSGGEKRRLSIAAMLAHDRPALLLDEPTLGLDRRDTVTTMTLLRAAAEEGRGILFASHDLRTVATLADRVVVLGEGRVLADGPVLDVLGDGDLRRRALLTLPPLVDWLMRNLRSPKAVRRALRALDDAVGQQ